MLFLRRLIIVLAFFSLGANYSLEYELFLGPGDEIFPSALVSSSSLKSDIFDEDPTVLGDQVGTIGIEIESPSDNAKIRVEIKGSKLFRESVFEGLMPKKGVKYAIFPFLKYDVDVIYSVKQPFQEVITAKVIVNGKELVEKSKRATIRSINDCLFAFHDGDEMVDTPWMLAAYVNENHPEIEVILKEALKKGRVESFSGYQGDRDDVMEELKAVWDTLRARGLKYSSITRSSIGDSEAYYCQHVRLFGESIKNTQANCVDGSVVFASILRKIGMDPFIVLLPEHAFVGVFLSEDHKKFICFETTMLSDSSFEEAVEEGMSQYKQHRKYLDAEMKNITDPKKKRVEENVESSDYAIVEIEDARQMGIMPIREPGAEKSKF